MNPSPVRTYAFTWIALLVLLALTAGSAFIPMGRLNLTVNLAIALAKALLVALFFMHLRDGTPMVRITALVGLLWLAMLALLSLPDYLARGF
jgi:cytochrome c oxidase subunit 4